MVKVKVEWPSETAFITGKLSENFMAVKFHSPCPFLLVNIGCREVTALGAGGVEVITVDCHGYAAEEKRLSFYLWTEISYLY